MKSTSIHNLNADKGLNLIEKPMYLLLNWLNNMRPYSNLDQRMEIKPFTNDKWKDIWSETYKESSAARKMSDIFWRTLPWQKIKKELGEIHIFDTGCGTGNYGARLYEASGGRVTSYTGIDAKPRPNWETLKKDYPNFSFFQSRSSNVADLMPKQTNFFMTQSAIEHFDEDLKFFEQIQEFISSANRPVIQVHIFPAGATLPLYLFHGFRQYTPRTISKITKIFKGSHNFYLFGLGGEAAKKIHFKYFTWPVLITRKYESPTFNAEEYDKKLKNAIEHDMANPVSSPIFWALIIHSNSIEEIW